VSDLDRVPLPGFEPARGPVTATWFANFPTFRPPGNRSRPLGIGSRTWHNCGALAADETPGSARQLGASYLLANQGGIGTLLGGVPGVPPGRVAILGAGVVGRHAAAVERLRELGAIFGHGLVTLLSDDATLEQALDGADLVIGAVLVPGNRTPQIIPRTHLPLVAPGGVIVDVSIDQGGCVETSVPTTHTDPIRIVDGVRHAAITNLPAAAARTATRALANVTLPYIIRLADLGTLAALRDDPSLHQGLSIYDGRVVEPTGV